MGNPREEKAVIRSVDRAFSVLETLSLHSGSLSLTELSQRLDLHPSTTHRLLTSLVQLGYVNQDPSTKEYSLGMKVLEISSGLDMVSNLKLIARKHLLELAREVGETVNLVVLDGSEALIIDRVESTQTLKYSVPIGTRLPLYCTAAGKALIAFQPEETINEQLQDELEVMTVNTIVDRYQLTKELEHVRAQGYAIDNEEREIGVRCAAAPIRDHLDNVIASISTSGPSRRMTPQYLAQVGNLVIETADAISSELGYLSPDGGGP